MKKWTLALVAVAAVVLAGCFKNNGAVNTPRAGVLIDLLSPNATNTSIYLNGNIIGSNISFGSVPNLYNQVMPGTTNIAVISSNSTELLNTSFPTEPGTYYSAFLVDSVSRMKALIVKDSVEYPNTTDSVKVRFYNFAPNSLPLSVAVKDGATLWSSRSFESKESVVANNQFMQLKAGTYSFQVFTPFNTTQSLKDTSITFDGKHIYTLFVKGFYPDSTGSTAIGLGVVKHG